MLTVNKLETRTQFSNSGSGTMSLVFEYLAYVWAVMICANFLAGSEAVEGHLSCQRGWGTGMDQALAS